MYVAAALIRAQANGVTYKPYSFTGVWKEVDKAELILVIDKHVPDLVHASFNNWVFTARGNSRFYASRATWDMGGISARSIAEFKKEIEDYYTRYAEVDAEETSE